MDAALALIIATLVPLFFLFIIRSQDLYRTGTLRYIVISIIWGGIAYMIAAQTNAHLLNADIISQENLTAYGMPVIEEILKGIILIILIRGAGFTYFVDGATYGFAAGIGFAIIENFAYILNTPETALVQAVGRVLSTNLMHATGSGIIGISLGIARFDRSTRRVLVFIIGLALAMVHHIAFNILVTRVTDGLLLLYAATAGFAGALFIAYTLKLGLNEEKRWIEEKLGIEDRVTTQEASAVRQLDNVEELLKPIEEKFGTEKAIQVENFLRKQARLGILRKTLEKSSLAKEEKLYQRTEAQINKLRDEMNQARKEVGAYCMLYLRGTFLEEGRSLWGRLQFLIIDRANAEHDSDSPDLWGSLNKKMTEIVPSVEEE